MIRSRASDSPVPITPPIEIIWMCLDLSCRAVSARREKNRETYLTLELLALEHLHCLLDVPRLLILVRFLRIEIHVVVEGKGERWRKWSAKFQTAPRRTPPPSNRCLPDNAAHPLLRAAGRTRARRTDADAPAGPPGTVAKSHPRSRSRSVRALVPAQLLDGEARGTGHCRGDVGLHDLDKALVSSRDRRARIEALTARHTFSSVLRGGASSSSTARSARDGKGGTHQCRASPSRNRGRPPRRPFRAGR